MKIAFFHELTPLSGALRVVEEYGKILGKSHSVDLFYVGSAEDKKIINIFNKIYFFEFKQKKYEGRDWKTRLYIDTIELLKLYLLHRKIAAVIKKNKYDFIFVNPSKFTQAPFLLRFIDKTIYFSEEPLRLVYDDLFKISKDLNLIKKMYEKINRNIRKQIDLNNIKKANIVLTNSLFSKNNIKKSYNISARLCYLGVNPHFFLPLNKKKDYDLLFIGEKNYIEGYDLLKKTLKLYKDKPKVKFIVRSSQGVGISEDNLIKEYNKAKIVLVLSRNEPFGLISIEAMSCGAPVIAVNEGGYKETVVDGETGYLVKRDPRVLAEKIDLLLKNPSLAKKLGENGRRHVVKNFTWEKSAKKLEGIFKEVIR